MSWLGWKDAKIIDPTSKFVVSHFQGRRDSALIRCLLEDGRQTAAEQTRRGSFHGREASYASLFREIFGIPYHRYRYSNRVRASEVHYRIPRSLDYE